MTIFEAPIAGMFDLAPTTESLPIECTYQAHAFYDNRIPICLVLNLVFIKFAATHPRVPGFALRQAVNLFFDFALQHNEHNPDELKLVRFTDITAEVFTSFQAYLLKNNEKIINASRLKTAMKQAAKQTDLLPNLMLPTTPQAPRKVNEPFTDGAFKDLVSALTALKKALVYYVIPNFAPFGTIRSFTTTTGKAGLFSLIERYIFKENFLEGDAQSIALINAKMINKSLDLAKNTASSIRHYLSLFYLIRLWGSLSSQGLMPDGLGLAVDMRLVDSIERKKDLLHFTGTLGTWKPYSEEELGTLVDHALFWTESALPLLLALVDYVKDKKIDKSNKSAITRYREDLEVEKRFNITVDNRIIVAATKNEYSYKNRGTSLKNFVYNWLNSYSAAIDNVRNGIYVLLALITGLRASELEPLRFDDITKDGEGNYTIRVTRYKTSTDPNEHGDLDFLPLPKFLGEKIDELKKLRSVYTLIGQGYIFQSCKSRKVVNKPNGHLLRHITRELGELTGLDRIHTHRFRKTIAEILINRSERNIDIIRHLFGHKSYAMTLSYIGRNPYLVRSVAQAIEQNYTEEFTELINAVTSSPSSGQSADRLIERIRHRPDAFAGKQLKVTIFAYISHLLSAGEPIFIHRTAVGSYCLSTESYSSPNLPPCLAIRKGDVTNALPAPTWCDVSCEHAVVVEKAKVAMEDNVKFYANMLEMASDTLSERAKKMLRDKIAGNTSHLERLRVRPERIPSVQVQA